MPNYKIVNDKNSNSQRSEGYSSEELQDLQTCFRAAGLPYSVSVSPTLATRFGWLEASPPGVDRYVVAWLVSHVMNGQWSHHKRQTQQGETLFLWFTALLNNSAKEADLQLAIVLGKKQNLHLAHPDEF